MPDRELLNADPIDPQNRDVELPQGYLTVELEDPDRSKLEAWVKNHLEQIESALADIHTRFTEELNQFEGRMPGGDYPYPGAFRINVPVTKKKVREIANRMKQAYLDSDPIWAVNSTELPMELAAAIEKGLDNQVDNHLDLADDLSQALFESVLHGAGTLEPCWDYFEDVRRDVESYHAFDGVDPNTLRDLVRFEQRYPNWKDNRAERRLHAKIANGQDVHVEVEYRVPTVNRPKAVHVPIKDVRAYPHLNSWEDLQRSPMYGYVKTYTRSELEDLADDGTIDAEQLGRVYPPREEGQDVSAQREMEEFTILRATVRYRLSGDEEPTRYKVWYERRSGTIIRLRKFQWWLDAPDLIFFHTRQEEPGIFKRGIAWDLKDTHTAANVTFSLYLNGADMANSMRWKAKIGSPAEQHILNRRWSPHLTIPWRTDPNEVEPMATATSHLGPLVQAHQMLRQQSDEDTQTTNLQTGRESPTDPDAPATKTIALLQQVEPNTKEYLRSLEPGFRQLGRWLIWMFYQGKRLGWITEIEGFPPLPDETLAQLATRLQPRALLFEFDRGQRLQADNMVLGWVSKLAPQAVPSVLRQAITHVNSDWAKLVDSLPLEAPSAAPTANAATSTSGTPPGGGDSSGNGATRPDVTALLGAAG